MTRLVTIYGGSGFVGRYVTQRMAEAGWRIRVAVRRPNEALFVRTYGDVGQVEPIYCDIRDDASVAAAMHGAQAVANCVGILSESGGNSFQAIHVEGAGRIARIAAEHGVGRMLHLSSLSADAGSDSDYARTKAEGEAEIRRHMPGATILRPSVIFGSEDGFFNRFAGMARFGPFLPIIGARTRFQPVWVEDVALAAEKALGGAAQAGIYELGGPDAMTLRELVEMMLPIINRRRIVVNLPFWAARLIAWDLDMWQKLGMGLIHNTILTRDQVRLLRRDNVLSGQFPGLADLGIVPTAMEAILPEYLWRFRPAGQYDEIRNSALNLKV